MLSVHVKEREGLDFSELQLSFRAIRVINHLPQTVRFLSQLFLNGNHLMSLTGIEQFHNLEVLHFDFNLVSLPKELAKIRNPFFLKDISFIANPIQHSVSREMLAEMRFTRLQRVNQLLERQCQPKRGKVRLAKHSDEAFTARRKPQYQQNNESPPTRRKEVGRIYCNPVFKQKQLAQHSKATRESTLKHNMEESAQELERTAIREVQPFSHSPQGHDDQTAKFSAESPLQPIGEQFLLQEKERLADAYYQRLILEKSFGVLKASDRLATLEEQLQPQLGQMLNNNLQTMHFSLIKLRHQFMRSC